MFNKIEFIPKSADAENFVTPPKPARNYEPTWLKNMPAFKNNKLEIDDQGAANLTAKMCVPFMDTFNFGYIQETWCDIHIEKDEEGYPVYSFATLPQIVDFRLPRSYDHDDMFYKEEFVWRIQWSPKVPKGYSVLFTHPLNRDDLPFYTLSGVVDADKYFYEDAGNHPFFVKKDFEGIIPKGTPMFQMIPFKRDNWKSDLGKFDIEIEKGNTFLRSKFWGVYKQNFWTKKTFK